MSASEIPYSTVPREDSGMTNPMLGLWLFLASEMMFFASLFSAYALLRLGSAGAQWPTPGERLSLGSGALLTMLLVLSSVTVFRAWSLARRGERSSRSWILATIALGAAFLLGQALEWVRVVGDGFLPRTDIYTALYFTLTGVHALHLVGVMLFLLFLATRGFSKESSPQFVQRLEMGGITWHFVDAVWLVLFPAFYLF